MLHPWEVAPHILPAVWSEELAGLVLFGSFMCKLLSCLPGAGYASRPFLAKMGADLHNRNNAERRHHPFLGISYQSREIVKWNRNYMRR